MFRNSSDVSKNPGSLDQAVSVLIIGTPSQSEYNDPNLTLETVSVKINELVGKSKIIENISYENFSVYTRRLFKNYVIAYR